MRHVPNAMTTAAFLSLGGVTWEQTEWRDAQDDAGAPCQARGWADRPVPRFFAFLQAFMGAMLGTWGFTLATAVQVSFERGRLYLHALLLTVFIALTAPVTTLFLMRAAVFRARIRGEERPVPGADEPPRT